MGGLALSVLALAPLVAAPAAQAGERAPVVPARLLLNLLNVPTDSPEAAFRERLLGSGPAPRPSPEWVILPDGSARYGTDTFGVIVQPLCVYGVPVALPGRGHR